MKIVNVNCPICGKIMAKSKVLGEHCCVCTNCNEVWMPDANLVTQDNKLGLGACGNMKLANFIDPSLPVDIPF